MQHIFLYLMITFLIILKDIALYTPVSFPLSFLLQSLQRQQSVASIEEDPLGTINFSIEFNYETSLLTVYLVEAENLVSRDFSGTSDPYCKVCVLPDRRNQLKSKVHRKTTNPVFDEEFIFELDPDMLHTMTLELLIYDYDQFSRHDCIGQVKLSLDNVDFSQRQTYWKPIAKREQKGISTVCIIPSICKKYLKF